MILYFKNLLPLQRFSFLCFFLFILFFRSYKTIEIASLKLSGLIALDVEVRVMVVLVLWHYNLFERCAANEHRCVYFTSTACQ